MNPSDAITVCISRTVRPGCEAAFEQALHEFVQRSLQLPGQLGVHVMRPAPGTASREYGIIRKFCNREALDTYRMSREYLAWNETIQELTEGPPRVEELNGLESWFTIPGERLRPLPRWKMALLTLLGVYPTSLVLGQTLGRWTRDWPLFLNALVLAVAMVGVLTWLVMPFLSRLLHDWLYTDKGTKLP